MAESQAASISLSGSDKPRATCDESSILNVVDDHKQFVSELFEQYREPLIRYLASLLSDYQDAEDIAQETYARLLKTSRLDRSGSRARSYLFSVATNLAYDRFRQRKVRGDESAAEAEELASTDPSPERIVAFGEGLEILKLTVGEMKPRCRRVFVLRAIEELSYEEIAERLGVSKRTVEREMRLALELCQEKLKSV